MRARIEAAQKRRSKRRSRCICAWATLLTGLLAAAVLLRGKPRPVVSISRAVHLQGSDTLLSNSSSTGAPASGAVAAAAAKAVADSKQQQSATADVGAAAGGNAQGEKQHFYDQSGKVLGEVVDEPIPEDCHPEHHADYGGTGLTWGLDYKTRSAAQCCAACKDEASNGCNVWVWCGDPSGLCWTPDIWNHTTGACWLKKQDKWDGSTDLKATNLDVNARGAYSAEFRKEHKSAPERVPWIAGLVKASGQGA